MEIKAFVGHSFAKDDADVVDAILGLLNQIAKLQPRFSWEHAEDPEPVLVDQKVMARFSGKNLFIGICTRKERVIDDSALGAPWLQPNKLAAKKDSFQWKVSDWILQEIGVATGRSMKVILLVENGIRRPGDIQGNLEYIPFDRARPTDCAPSLIAMISALSPPEPIAQTSSPPPQTELAPAATREHSTPEWDWRNPEPSWHQAQFDSAIFTAVVKRRRPPDLSSGRV